MNKSLLFILLIWVSVVAVSASNPIVFSNTDEILSIGKDVYLLEDKTGLLTIDDVVNSTDFIKSEEEVPNLGITPHNIWVKIEIQNSSKEQDLILAVNNSLLNEITLYVNENGKYSFERKLGEAQIFSDREYDDPNYLFDINVSQGINIVYLKIRSWENIQLPIQIGTIKKTFESKKNNDFIIGVYSGIMLIMIFYNLFIYLSIKDYNYLYYVIYIITILITQLNIKGYAFQFLWRESNIFAVYSFVVMACLVGVSSMIFVINFLKIKDFYPKQHLVFLVFVLLYFCGFMMVFFNPLLGQKIINFTALILSLFFLLLGILISTKKYKPAKYFLVAWSVFLIGIVIYIFKDLNILPYNIYTNNMMLVGSALETVLLSFALADRINTLKREKLEVLETNQQLIINQNVVLEQKVKERTFEIEQQKQIIEEQRVKEVRYLRYKALTAQMNPHFIFNSLNSIRSFVLNNEPLRADGFLTRFARLMRSMLDNSRQDFCLLTAEIEAITNYLELEQLRFEHKFSYSINIDENIELYDTKIPSFLIQPYIENAVLHGVSNRIDGKITISFKEDDANIVCVIEDNGVGRGVKTASKPYKSVGMSITKERLSSIGTSSSVQIIDLIGDQGSPKGTRVELIINTFRA